VSVVRRLFSEKQANGRPTRRWVRIVAIALVGIGLLIGAIYGALVVAFPPARLAALLSDQVTAATGRFRPATSSWAMPPGARVPRW
jgi:hypothetical protein